MACAKPLDAWRPAKGGPPRIAKLPTTPTDTYVALPCGQCILCRLEYARQWAVRITHEGQLHERKCFGTLTYANENLPEMGSLNYRHLETFWKRLRKRIGKFKYYAVGEYGDKYMRPHYHFALFGEDFADNKTILETQPFMLWTNDLLQKTWGLGYTSVGALDFTTAQYVSSYVTKKLNNNDGYVYLDEETGEITWLEQPDSRISNRPAIAKNWLDKYGNAVYDHDQVVANGRPQKPPKYYDQWLKTRSETKHLLIKEKRMENVTVKTPEQNRARARNAHARAKQRSKTL